jgi:hypothetical protein
MDLYTANAAHTLHAQDAQRAIRELEYRRVAKERAAATASAPGNTETPVPAQPQRSRGLFAFLLMRGHRAAAQ